PTADHGREVNEAEIAANDPVRLIIGNEEVLGEVEDEQRPHAIEAEPLPHLDREKPRKLPRVAEPRLLRIGIDVRDVRRVRRFRAGRIDHLFLSPEWPATVTAKSRL